jgi:hypothetical protein
MSCQTENVEENEFLSIISHCHGMAPKGTDAYLTTNVTLQKIFNHFFFIYIYLKNKITFYFL